MRPVSTLLLSVSLLLLSWATIPAGEKDKKEKEPIPTFTDEDAGKTFPMEKDGKFRVKLKSNATTGFQWEVAKSDTKVIKLLDKKYEAPKKAIPGAGGAQTFEFQAIDAGKTNIEFIYRRPFEKDVKAAKTYKLTIEVK